MQCSRMHLEASTSGKQHSIGTIRPHAERKQRCPLHCRRHLHRDSWVTCRASASPEKEQQQRPAGTTAQQQDSAWSSKLLQLTKKKRNSSSKTKRSSDLPPPPPEEAAIDGAEFIDFEDGEGDYEDRAPGSSIQGLSGKRLPAVMRCFDTAAITVRSGDGGAGCVAFRREPFVERGGPNGGNGGRGGSVWAVADSRLNSLAVFRRQPHWRAQAGQPGKGSNMGGADAPEQLVRVPLGTIIRQRDAEEGAPPLAELVEEGQRALLLPGGRGGRGNTSFKTRLNTAPAIAERGEAGQELVLDLELKVVADVGIVGVPNAGKSTLLGVLTAAKPKVADYPFTTLVPNLGVCEMDFQTTVFADVPGLLEGAHEGHGLGHEFLRHVQRCRALVHVVDGSSPDPVGDFRAIQLELELFSPELKDKPQVVAYNKVDLPDSGDYWDVVREVLVTEEGLDSARVLAVSAATGQGVTELVRVVREVLAELGPAPVAMETNALNITQLPKRIDASVRIDSFSVERDPAQLPDGSRLFLVQGEAIERFTQMTNWDYYEAVKRFQRVLEVSGINQALRDAGAADGDTVALGDHGEFVWSGDQSEAALYGAWLDDMAARRRPRTGKGSWPSGRGPGV